MGGAAAAVGSAATSVAGSAARLALGSSVVLVGLKAKPQLNGHAASVLGWDETKGRYNIALSSGGVLALKPANLMQASGGGGGASVGGGASSASGGFGDLGIGAAAVVPDVDQHCRGLA